MKKVKRSERLTIVRELAERELDEQAEQFRKAQDFYAKELTKLDDLRLYRDGYRKDANNQIGLSSVDQIARERQFLCQINEAVEQQKKLVEQYEKVVEQKKSVWQTAHLKHRALAELIDRIAKNEDQALGKAEQKLLDEWFTQSSSHRV